MMPGEHDRILIEAWRDNKIWNHLGRAFFYALFSKEPTTSVAVQTARRTRAGRIIGTRFADSGAQVGDLDASFADQLELPNGSKLEDAARKMAGKENGYLVVILGASRLGDYRRFLEMKLQVLGKIKVVVEE